MSPYRDGPASGREAAPPPDVLLCAGLDPSGGAGLIADVRVAGLVGVRPVGVVTALTIQNTQGVRSAHPLDADVVGAQIATLLSDVEVKAVKLGMLGAIDVAREIADGLHLTAAPVVWDPVAAPSLGDVSFDRDMFGAMLRELSPHLTLITPNTSELAALLGRPIADADDLTAAARHLAVQLGAAVLAKGGHAGGPESVDVLVSGDLVERLRSPRVAGGEDVHGTGCALSTAIASHLALGASLVEACRAAKELVVARIASPVRPGRGAAAIV
ncbi:MAG TPA: bifunctional hydroxymethylpyrimidine kinase/phosphomethylpyrimidine kinase [Kofleriaceae bacterium]|nr:bifunctional hydroxymethylpyrimidine kinase/phosphomethylpyrimidine kinase [Kofleriaceae bacterium]